MTAVFNRIRTFAHEHDDVPAFHATYLVGAVLAAALFNLGFFAILILGHMSLDFVKYREIHKFDLPTTFKAIFLESIADIALFLLSLTVGIYLNHAYVLTALSGLLRSELTIVSAVGTIIPKIRILEDICAIFLNLHGYLHSIHPNLKVPFTRLQHWSLTVTYACLFLLGMSILLFHNNEARLLGILAHELIPTL